MLYRGVGVEAECTTWGLLTLWNEDLVTIKDCISNKWCVILVRVLNKLNKEAVLCNVYTPNLEKERRELWGFILNVQQSFLMPWCIGGDFNMVFNEFERKGGSLIGGRL